MWQYTFKNQESMNQTLTNYQIPNDQIHNPQMYPDGRCTIITDNQLPTNPFWSWLLQITKTDNLPVVDFQTKTAFWYDTIKADTLKELCKRLTEQHISPTAVIGITYDKTFYEHVAVIVRNMDITNLWAQACQAEQQTWQSIGITGCAQT